jgi:thioredoxin-related protein
MEARSSHPHFDDRGTLLWHTRFADALAEARAQGKPMFIELGREQCGQCRSLVEAVVPRSDVGPILRERFVSLAADADDAEPEVEELAMRLEDAMMLPFVLFADAQGQFLEGTSGLVEPKRFVATLKRLSGMRP